MEKGTTLLNSREWHFPKELSTWTLQLFLCIQAEAGRNPDWVEGVGGVWGQRHRNVSKSVKQKSQLCSTTLFQTSGGLPTALFK